MNDYPIDGDNIFKFSAVWVRYAISRSFMFQLINEKLFNNAYQSPFKPENTLMHSAFYETLYYKSMKRNTDKQVRTEMSYALFNWLGERVIVVKVFWI